MKISKVSIHNFRSIKKVQIDLEDYSLLVGENNAGKTNVLTALRMFYEDQGLKFDENRDLPKFPTDDNESWIELEFQTSEEEQKTLDESYRSPDKILKVRRYLRSKQFVKSGKSNIYAYENVTISSNIFYDAKNISEARLGKVIYIPAVTTINENTKLSGPSPFRDMINFVFDKVVSQSTSFQSLNSTIEKFGNDFKTESSGDGISMDGLMNEINLSLNSWGIDLDMNVEQLQPQDIVKSLLSYSVKDRTLGEIVDINSLGQGLQRHLIYTLIKLSSKYSRKKEYRKTDFFPDFSILLFEEPEAFLHPSQQVQLNAILSRMAIEEDQQILISTHSPTFVSKNLESLTSLLSVKKREGVTYIFQLRKYDIEELLNENNGLFKRFSEILEDEETNPDLKGIIKKERLGGISVDYGKKLEEESVKYSMWLDAERTASFFAKHVIICEGATEKVAFEHLISNSSNNYIERHIYILDAMGKYNIHRYMNIFGKLGITHSVLYDRDQDVGKHKIINDFINKEKNAYTKKIYTFDSNLEQFLGIDKAPRNDLKPMNVLIKLKNSKISKEKIKELCGLFESLCNSDS